MPWSDSRAKRRFRRPSRLVAWSRSRVAEFEISNSATLLRDQATNLEGRLKRLLARLSDQGIVTDYVIDAIAARNASLAAGVGWIGA